MTGRKPSDRALRHELRPVRLERGVLIIRAATATWAQELSLLANDIVARLRHQGIGVSSLRFRVGQVEAPARSPSRDSVRSSPAAASLPPALTSEVLRVGDPDLRDAIAAAAATNLGWQGALESAEFISDSLRSAHGAQRGRETDRNRRAVSCVKSEPSPAPEPAGHASTSTRAASRDLRFVGPQTVLRAPASATARGARRGRP